MAPFCIWFAVIILVLVAAMLAGAFPVSLPVPWTGVIIVTLVLAVLGLPMLYGRIYVRDGVLGCGPGDFSVHGSSDGHVEDDTNFANDSSEGLRLEDDLLEGEAFPLLRAPGNVGDCRTLDLACSNMTWRQCIQVGTWFCYEVYDWDITLREQTSS